LKLTDEKLIAALKALNGTERRAIEACIRAGPPPTWFESQAIRKVKAMLKRKAKSRWEPWFKWLH